MLYVLVAVQDCKKIFLYFKAQCLRAMCKLCALKSQVVVYLDHVRLRGEQLKFSDRTPSLNAGPDSLLIFDPVTCDLSQVPRRGFFIWRRYAPSLNVSMSE